jgi:hypothetical protein
MQYSAPLAGVAHVAPDHEQGTVIQQCGIEVSSASSQWMVHDEVV